MTVYILRNRFAPGVRRAGEKALRGAALAVSTGCFVGFAPKAPGTAASLAGVAIWALCPQGPAYYLVCGFVLAMAFFSAGYAENKIFREKDPPEIVIDEIAGALVTFLSFSFSPSPRGLLTCAAGFLLFRFFDVLKPSPVRLLQRLPGGPGVVLDDLAAGVLANAGLQILRFACGLCA
jgi:phosphatidylglycerophosphatase A